MVLPLITVDSWDEVFEQRGRYQLEPILPAFIAARRWFRSKARAIRCIAIDDAIRIGGAEACVLVLRIEYADGACDNYLLPLTVAKHSGSDELLAEAATPDGARRVIGGALANPQFRDALLNAIRCEEKFEGKAGEMVASRTKAYREECGDADLRIESFVSRAEQSNTSIIYRDRYILKLFRKVEPGVNPDIEIGRFLTGRGFKHTPAVLGTLEYRLLDRAQRPPDGLCAQGGDAAVGYAAGILQEFVPNQGDAWKYTLEALSGFFARALAQGEQAPEVKRHPLELMKQEMPVETRELLEAYADSARLLGKRTAEMHAALADENGGPDFAPERFAQEDAEKLYEEMLGQADITFELLKRKQGAMEGSAAESAQELLQMEDRVRERFSALRAGGMDAVRMRSHGDYHLGQVLWTGKDFMIIDFEGEPARPLADRRAKTLAMRDVAGMIRSFQYAAFAALFGQVSGVPVEPESMSAVEGWAAYWTAWVSAAYLHGYFEEAGTCSFVPADAEQRRILFDAFLLQKALYEVAYELNNRPDWARIPLRGILSLMN
ncbi:MAG TPA: putative maltokinase [Bryobacteraceae bacterium]|jgi:maltose alpha-D-glucosyltransferase/alpha-amylase|nr:putative maltokinase [Bryobacteraceae bacterium]